MTAPLTPMQRQGNWHFANSLAILAIRLVLGWTFVYAGAGKLFGAFGGIGMDTWIGAMTAMKLPVLSPTAWAYLSAVSEFVGGLLVLVGLLTRLACVPLIITMLVAITTVTGQNGFGGTFDKEKGMQMGYQLNLDMIAMSIALILTGAGLISLDALIFKRSLWARGPQPLDNPVKRG